MKLIALNNNNQHHPLQRLGDQVDFPFTNQIFEKIFVVLEESVPSILPIDFNTLLENLRELNVLAGESEMRFQPQNPANQRHISTLKRTEPINLTLYANGIFLFNGPFRAFSGRNF
jgi:hypothetical protein